MILLATNKRDITTDFVVLELRRRGLPFVRINTEDLPQGKVIYRPGTGNGWVVECDGQRVSLSSVTAGYYRRPGPPTPENEGHAPEVQDYRVEEWSAILRSIWNALEGRWFNSPFSILRAEDKPRQLSLAEELGFDIPSTLISNDFVSVSTFSREQQLVGKPLRRALIERGEAGEVLFTSRVGAISTDDQKAIELAPVIYQREIPKQYDVRVTVVDEQVFPVAIHSQEQLETQVDWRNGSNPNLRHEIIDLPHHLEKQCIGIVKKLGLRYGAIDLVLDAEGRYWFLEINPNGQWAWIERQTGLPIARAIVNSLAGFDE